MLFFSSAHSKHKLCFRKLSNCLEYAPLAAKWTHDEWGYIYNKDVGFHTNEMQSISNNVYIGFFGESPIAMFALLKKEYFNGLKAYELDYVFVEKDYRGFGFGKQIINKAKNIAEQENTNLIVLETFKPLLNKFYEKQGSKVICEGRLSTDVLRISI